MFPFPISYQRFSDVSRGIKREHWEEILEDDLNLCNCTFTNCTLTILSKFDIAIDTYKSSLLQMFFKMGVLKNFADFTGKHFCWSLFLIKVFPVNLAKFFKKNFLTPPMAPSSHTPDNQKSIKAVFTYKTYSSSVCHCQQVCTKLTSSAEMIVFSR